MSDVPRQYLVEVYSLSGELQERKIAREWDDVVALLDTYREKYYGEKPNVSVNITPIEVVG